MSGREGLPSLSGQSDAILDDWASCRFTLADLARKYLAAESSIMDNIIGRARAGGDPRALRRREVRERQTAASAPAPKAARAPEAERLGVKPGQVVVKRNIYGTSANSRERPNRITLSGGLLR